MALFNNKLLRVTVINRTWYDAAIDFETLKSYNVYEAICSSIRNIRGS